MRTALCVLLLLNTKIGFADQQQVILSNEHLVLHISTKGNRVQTTRIENRRASKKLDLDGDDFVLEFEDGSIIRSRSLTLDEVSKKPDG